VSRGCSRTSCAESLTSAGNLSDPEVCRPIRANTATSVSLVVSPVSHGLLLQTCSAQRATRSVGTGRCSPHGYLGTVWALCEAAVVADHLIDEQPERPKVDGEAMAEARDLLGREVVREAAVVAWRRLGADGIAHIDELRVAELVDGDAGWVEVAEEHTAHRVHLGVQVLDGREHL
jgi:hypothetical protein